MRALLVLFVLSGCVEPVEDDLPGRLVHVEVVLVDGGCSPERFEGDAGVQFFGVRPDGGLVFTMSQQAQFGPTLDGGSLESVQRQGFPAINGGRATVGNEVPCEGSFSNWEPLGTDLVIRQSWPGADACLSGPVWLPARACETTRHYVLTEVGTCQLRCVRISASHEVECGC